MPGENPSPGEVRDGGERGEGETGREAAGVSAGVLTAARVLAALGRSLGWLERELAKA